MPANFSFEPYREQIKLSYKIDDKEFDRVLEVIRIHEFMRPYTHWNLVCLRWFRTADDRNELRRPRTYSSTAVKLSDDERASDQQKFEADMKRLRLVK